MAHMKGGHRRTLHSEKHSRYHQTEGTLRQWLIRRRKHQILVAKKMMIKKANEVSATIHALTASHLEDWWATFRQRRRFFVRRVSSSRRASEDHVLLLARRYFLFSLMWTGCEAKTGVNLER